MFLGLWAFDQAVLTNPRASLFLCRTCREESYHHPRQERQKAWQGRLQKARKSWWEFPPPKVIDHRRHGTIGMGPSSTMIPCFSKTSLPCPSKPCHGDQLIRHYLISWHSILLSPLPLYAYCPAICLCPWGYGLFIKLYKLTQELVCSCAGLAGKNHFTTHGRNFKRHGRDVFKRQGNHGGRSFPTKGSWPLTS